MLRIATAHRNLERHAALGQRSGPAARRALRELTNARDAVYREFVELLVGIVQRRPPQRQEGQR